MSVESISSTPDDDIRTLSSLLSSEMKVRKFNVIILASGVSK